jgi:hypothetical protein
VYNYLVPRYFPPSEEDLTAEKEQEEEGTFGIEKEQGME